MITLIDGAPPAAAKKAPAHRAAPHKRAQQ
jgi:hypothetical protein